MGALFSRHKHKTNERDVALLQLKLQRDKFRQTERRLNISIEALKCKAIEAARQDNKTAALRCLRKKKAELNLRDRVLNNTEQIERMIMDIEDAEVQLQVVSRLKQGNEALKSLHELMKLDDVQKIVDDSIEAREYQQEIENLLIGNVSEADFDGIDKELELLQMDGELINELPNVPETDIDKIPVKVTKPSAKTLVEAFMDRLRRCASQSLDHDGGESFVVSQSNTKIYDGTVKTCYEKGTLQLTNYRLIWIDTAIDSSSSFSLPLISIKKVYHEGGHWVSTPKICLTLDDDESIQYNLQAILGTPKWASEWIDPALAVTSKVFREENSDTIKFGFSGGSDYKDFEHALNECISAKCWETFRSVVKKTGILGIEREKVYQINTTDSNIKMAVEDLEQLMKHAADIVKISKDLNKKLAENDESAEEDDVVAWRNEMLLMGIDLEESKSSNLSGNPFYKNLAKEICAVIYPLMKVKNSQNEGDGSVDLATAFCRFNRARGLDLISPKDMLHACQELEGMKMPIVLKTFPSNVKILELASEKSDTRSHHIAELVTKSSCLSVSDLARIMKISTTLAKERLLMSEDMGLLCRDDSDEGLKFYPNKFLQDVN